MRCWDCEQESGIEGYCCGEHFCEVYDAETDTLCGRPAKFSHIFKDDPEQYSIWYCSDHIDGIVADDEAGEFSWKNDGELAVLKEEEKRWRAF